MIGPKLKTFVTCKRSKQPELHAYMQPKCDQNSLIHRQIPYRQAVGRREIKATKWKCNKYTDEILS